MAALPKTHRRVVLVRRPPGEPAESDFRIEEVPMPEPRHGEVLVKVLYLSLDPYQRGRMREAASYAPRRSASSEVMTGGTVGEVVKSNHPGFKEGDIVEDRLGWQEYAIGGGPALRKVDPSIAPISTANGVLGMPGMTAYFGLLEVGQPKPGETIVVSAASGAVGQVVGQIGRIMGCRVVGIAGGREEMRLRNGRARASTPASTTRPRRTSTPPCAPPAPTASTSISTMSAARSPTPCCATSTSSAASRSAARSRSTTPPRRRWARGCSARSSASACAPRASSSPTSPSATARRAARSANWIRSGKLKYREDVVEGIDKAPRAFIGLLRGENFGKMLVKLA